MLGKTVKEIGNYTDKSTVAENVPLLGLQDWVPKNEFVKNPQAMVCGIEHFGQAMGRGENSSLLKVFLSNGTTYNVTEDNFVARISEVIEEMKKKNNDVNAILTGSRKIVRTLQKSEIYKPYWGIQDSIYKKLQGYEGNLGELPVFFVHELEKETICLIDLKKIGVFNQYRVKEADTSILHIEVHSIDVNRAKELMKANPKHMQNEKGETISEIEATDKLQQFVIVKIMERFEFELENKDACSILRVESNNAGAESC